MTLKPRPWRLAAGAVVLLLLASLGIRLAPVYFRNLEFQRHLESIASEPTNLRASDERIRVAVVSQASRLGLPVKMEQVRISRPANGLRIEVRYAVPVELSLYAVDLHFSPKAGVR